MASWERFNTLGAGYLLSVAVTENTYRRYTLACAAWGAATHEYEVENSSHAMFDEFPELLTSTDPLVTAQALIRKVLDKINMGPITAKELLNTAMLRVCGHVMFLCQQNETSWPDDATNHIMRQNLLLMLRLRIRRQEPLAASTLLKVSSHISYISAFITLSSRS